MQSRFRRIEVRRAAFLTISMLLLQVVAGSERMYAPFSDYAMSQQAEIALARSAAPNSISAHATIEVLTSKCMKESGLGREGGQEGITEYLETKLIGISVTKSGT